MCDDLISRQAAIALSYFHGKNATWDNPTPDGVDAVDVADLEVLPTVQPEQETGEWVYGEFDIPHCSICGHDVMPNMVSPYCPNCGAKMGAEPSKRGDENGPD